MAKGKKGSSVAPSPSPSQQKGAKKDSPASAPASASASASAHPGDDGWIPEVPSTVKKVLLLVGLSLACYMAYNIRLYAVETYGAVIHEFDPWFNFRATEYLVANGWSKFISWYDYESWYPLGRPVGTTIYPGMQVTAAFIFQHLNPMGMSLNDVCVYMPAWFGVITTLLTFLLGREVSGGNTAAGVFSAIVMSILPAHLMRSVAGGFDNESVAVAALVGTFFCWVRSLRTGSSWMPWGIATGAAYIYMVAAWGGYVFVLNMIGVHAGLLILFGRFTYNLWASYSIFYVIGTLGAIQFPIVGLQPLQSMEQLGPMGVFFLLQLWAALHFMFNGGKGMTSSQWMSIKIQAVVGAGIAALVVLYLILPDGFIGPLSARVRGLFVAHTKTGNPLVDSVAEHQATPMDVYFKYFHVMHYFGPVGMGLLALKRTDSASFMVAFFLMAGYFSTKMIRLVLLLGPASAVCSGVAISAILSWSVGQMQAQAAAGSKPAAETSSSPAKNTRSQKRNKAGGKEGKGMLESFKAEYEGALFLRRVFALLMLALLVASTVRFAPHSFVMAGQLSHPSIMIQGRNRDGSIVMIDDFREAYWWLRDNTPEDSRVMAWWDYGYQINGIGNRTTIADGNTWNHEHIALLGKCLVSDEVSSHRITRHLADYVLVWSTRYGGMAGDDLAKMPHMGRIAGSVYKDVPQDGYWQDQHGNPSELMRKSLLFQVHSSGIRPDVPPMTRFEEAFTSEHRMVRIFKVKNVDEESKQWCKDHPGQYPPALEKVLAQKNDFKQIHGIKLG